MILNKKNRGWQLSVISVILVGSSLNFGLESFLLLKGIYSFIGWILLILGMVIGWYAMKFSHNANKYVKWLAKFAFYGSVFLVVIHIILLAFTYGDSSTYQQDQISMYRDLINNR